MINQAVGIVIRFGILFILLYFAKVNIWLWLVATYIFAQTEGNFILICDFARSVNTSFCRAEMAIAEITN